MCTIISKKQKGHPKTAETDIEVFKICNKFNEDIATSLFQDYPYRKDKKHETDFTYADPRYEGGLDAKEAKYYSSLEGEAECVKNGFHALNTLDKDRISKLGCLEYESWICSFIIPKGSKYYKNPTGCIVSNQIIFNNFIYQP